MKGKFFRLYWPKTKIVILFSVVIFFCLVFFHIYTLLNNLAIKQGFNIQLLNYLLINKGNYLKNSDNITNILFLGVGGALHEGGDLTDSIIILSLHSGKSIKMLSIPRDLWSSDLQDKINSAYHYGQQKKPGGGLTFAQVTIEDLIGIPIHYVVLLDFQIFKKIIDAVGGVEVNVKTGFTDELYPIEGKENAECPNDSAFKCRYKTVTFQTGQQFMNGDKALEFVRSRHSASKEGSDFSRGERQQEIILALRNKLFKWQQIFNVNENLEISRIINETVKSNLSPGEYLVILSEFYKYKGVIGNFSIEPFLYVPNAQIYQGKYVLVPNNMDEMKNQLRFFINN
jgi:LCP family protein required for cell wall assembly